MYLKKELYSLIKTDESIFDFIQESALDGLWYRDLENPENEWMNAKFWTVLGYNPDEMPHNSSAWQGIINQEDLKLASDNLNRHCENPNHPYDQIVRYTHKNGSIVWIRCRGMAIRDADGKPIRMLGAHQDVSDIKNREQELITSKDEVHESEEKYRAFYKNAPLSYQSLDENGCFIDINPMWLETLGYERDEVIGKWYGDFLHPEFVEHFRINFPAFKKRGHVSDVQFKLRRKDNTYIFVSFDGCVGYTPEGKFRQTYCVFKDITEQKALENAVIKAKEKAEESEENLSITLHSIGDGVITTDKFGMIDKMNPVALKLCGWHEDEIIGKPLTEVFKIISAETRNPVPNPVEKVIAEGEIVGLANHTVLISKDGREYQIADSAAPIKDKNGVIKGVVLVFSDISGKYAAEEALQKSETSLQAVLNSTADGILAIGKENEVLYANQRFLELWRIPSYLLESNDDSILLQFILDQLSDPDGFLLKVKELYGSDKESFDTLYFNDGRVFERMSRPLLLESEMIGRVWSFRDITQRKQAEQELLVAKEKAEESEAKQRALSENLKLERILLRTIVDSIPDAIYVKDLEYRKVLANKADCQNCGLEKEKDIIGKTDFDVFPAELAERLMDDDRKVIEEGVRVVNREECLRNRDYNEKWLLTSKLPLYDDTGKIIGLVGIGHDFTERKLAEKALLEKITELERFHKLTIGREITMVELKKEVNNLLENLGDNPKYKIVE
jgi:PAS domain S-box-containing protein